jgi:hypothetical protein
MDRPSSEFTRNQGDKWFECKLCGKVFLFVDMAFDQGTVEPVVGEVLTGASSGCTGVVDRVKLFSGSWAEGDAKGNILLTEPTGYVWPDVYCFDTGEIVTGDGGAAMVTDGYGLLKRSGRLWRLGDTILKDGDRYCIDHYKIHWGKRITDRAKSTEVEDLDVREVEDREMGYLE